MAGLVAWGVGGLLIYFITKAVYRLYFHPLRNIPGPKLAALSSAYEFYFNVIKQGTFIWHLEGLHETYGRWSGLAHLDYAVQSSFLDRSHCSR
jgi:hypothetical protein